MADKTPIEPVPEKKWQIAEKWAKQDEYRGSRYPPFSIEPVPYERQRLAGEGMSAEDRALRKQWIKDQELSPNEPRHVKELKPRNIFRRVYQAPANVIFAKLAPFLGQTPAAMCRVVVPKMLLSVFVGYWAYYQLKYHPNDWTRTGGFSTYWSKPMLLSARSDKVYPEKQHDDYFDCRFKARTVLREGKTSAQI